NVSSMLDLTTDSGRALADAIVTVQAQIIAFGLDYQMVMLVTLGAVPLALMIGSSKAALRAQSKAPDDHAAVLE
ncbi:MAG: drug resistance transporter, EmrB/QacA subfamily, partial [Tardiphaga sp.]|nr:drug resistance transporter, EmrB/QacA subfamily [Tardiphaga sp.]